ncbi:hypothetical protein ACQKWADRAFT_319549 [Trichoderma austrokoningii]
MFRVNREPDGNWLLPSNRVEGFRRRFVIEDTTKNPAQNGPSSISSSKSSSTCILAERPLNILFMILDRLPTSSVISLSLTRKDLYMAVKLFYRSRLALKDCDIAEFLMVLQRDIPRVFCCPACRRLCPLNLEGTWRDQIHQNCSGSSYWAWWDWCSTQRRYSNWDMKRLLWHPGAREAKLSFMDAYLVMDRHFYGSRHGLPLRNLERHAKFERYIHLNDKMDFGIVEWNDRWEMKRRRSNLKAFKRGVFKRRPKASTDPCFDKPWRFSYDYVPKIIGDNLYIGRFNRIDGPLVNWKQFAALLGSVYLPLCYHLEVVAEYHGDILIQHTDDLRFFSYVISDQEVDEECGSCPDCFTDYDFCVTKDEQKQEWSVRFSTFHCLGPCRSPNDASWSRLRHVNSERNNDVGEDEEESERDQAGRARYKWYEALAAEYAGRF